MAIVTLGGFEADARRAIACAPEYFVRWYTWKSLALVAACAALAFVVGRDRGRSRT